MYVVLFVWLVGLGFFCVIFCFVCLFVCFPVFISAYGHRLSLSVFYSPVKQGSSGVNIMLSLF